jgi:hypothetical protein
MRFCWLFLRPRRWAEPLPTLIPQLPAFPGSLTRNEVITLAQPFCDTSFTVPEAGAHYTCVFYANLLIQFLLLVLLFSTGTQDMQNLHSQRAWNSMGSLTRKGYVEKKHSPAKYAFIPIIIPDCGLGTSMFPLTRQIRADYDGRGVGAPASRHQCLGGMLGSLWRSRVYNWTRRMRRGKRRNREKAAMGRVKPRRFKRSEFSG